MKVPSSLASDFGETFQNLVGEFATAEKLLPDPESLTSDRFLVRSVIPHVKKLSDLFNRLKEEVSPLDEDLEGDATANAGSRRKQKMGNAGARRPRVRQADQEASLDPYWKESSNPAHLRLAYLLYFMPSNLFRVASVSAELHRLGFKWAGGETLRAIEFGAGPATGACGIAAAEKHASIGLPRTGNWALLEQDKAVLQMGTRWAETYFQTCGVGDWGTRPFHRTLGLIGKNAGFLPRTAPKFNLWLMSYFLNELPQSPAEIAAALLESWERHLEEEGLAILVEPALKLQSRKILEVRKELLALAERKKIDWLKILLPCLGHQKCGALGLEGDWCHEEVTWWRPPYFRQIDKMAGLDRKTLPFSYLVITRSRRSHQELLPELAGSHSQHRLVSPAHAEGKEMEFYLCGADGKRRARFRPTEGELERGHLLLDAQLRGATEATRVDSISRMI